MVFEEGSILPRVHAFDDVVDYCNEPAMLSSKDAVLQNATLPLPFSTPEGEHYLVRGGTHDYQSWMEAILKVGRCGPTQRTTYMNVPCTQATGMLGAPEPAGYSFLTGAEAVKYIGNDYEGCLVREPVRVGMTCVEGTCGASGLCLGGRCSVVDGAGAGECGAALPAQHCPVGEDCSG